MDTAVNPGWFRAILFFWLITTFFPLALMGWATETVPKLRISLSPPYLDFDKVGDKRNVATVVRNNTSKSITSKLTWQMPKGLVIQPSHRNFTVNPNSQIPLFFQITLKDKIGAFGQCIAKVICERKKFQAVLKAGETKDLTLKEWLFRYDTQKEGEANGWQKIDYDDSSWEPTRLPKMWSELGYSWCRLHLTIPEWWRDKEIYLCIAAIDDNDVTFFNGYQIGKTEGWDIPRNYLVPSEYIRFGQDNVIAIRVDNIYAGGGIYRVPIKLTVGPPKLEIIERSKKEVKLMKVAKIGLPKPVKKMYVKNGVLYYSDNTEVALWGINYYPQSWWQYENMKRLGVDHKKAMDEDFNHFEKLGVEVIRIHVFDREITDLKGNLIDNTHLDLLDYLVYKCHQKGIYLFFTPIAWWWSPNERKDSFSANYCKEALIFYDEAKAAQVNYLKQFMNHTNRYTNITYKEEPVICLFEIINEPWYWNYNEMIADIDKNLEKQWLYDKWLTWCKDKGTEADPAFYTLFRYETVLNYYNTMIDAIRSTGAKQPIAVPLFASENQDDILQALADCKSEAVTTGAYPGNWSESSDNMNLLPTTANRSLDQRFGNKAKLVYEFDAVCSTTCYMYPAMARMWRNMGVQVACMFQYDTIATASYNSDWSIHYLNLLYTPQKAISFRIAREVFHRLPRGATFETPPDNQTFGGFAVSFEHNLSLMSTKEAFMHSNDVTWNPLKIHPYPKYIIGYGNSPFVEYDGKGMYIMEIGKKEIFLEIFPDAILVGDPWHPSLEKPVTKLEDNLHIIQIKLKGWDSAEVFKIEKSDKEKVCSGVAGYPLTFVAKPGKYLIQR